MDHCHSLVLYGMRMESMMAIPNLAEKAWKSLEGLGLLAFFQIAIQWIWYNDYVMMIIKLYYTVLYHTSTIIPQWHCIHCKITESVITWWYIMEWFVDVSTLWMTGKLNSNSNSYQAYCWHCMPCTLCRKLWQQSIIKREKKSLIFVLLLKHARMNVSFESQGIYHTCVILYWNIPMYDTVQT